MRVVKLGKVEVRPRCHHDMQRHFAGCKPVRCGKQVQAKSDSQISLCGCAYSIEKR